MAHVAFTTAADTAPSCSRNLQLILLGSIIVSHEALLKPLGVASNRIYHDELSNAAAGTGCCCGHTPEVRDLSKAPNFRDIRLCHTKE